MKPDDVTVNVYPRHHARGTVVTIDTALDAPEDARGPLDLVVMLNDGDIYRNTSAEGWQPEREDVMSVDTYTVVGLWVDDVPLVAGVIPGAHSCADVTPESDGFTRWALTVEADGPDAAESVALNQISE